MQCSVESQHIQTSLKCTPFLYGSNDHFTQSSISSTITNKFTAQSIVNYQGFKDHAMSMVNYQGFKDHAISKLKLLMDVNSDKLVNDNFYSCPLWQVGKVGNDICQQHSGL